MPSLQHNYIQSNLSYPDSCYPGTSLNRAADLPYFMLTLQKLWAIWWVWPITAYVFILYSEIRTNLSYGHPLIPRCPDKRGLTVRKEPHATYIIQPLVSIDCYLCPEGFGQDQHITHHSLIGTAQGEKKKRGTVEHQNHVDGFVQLKVSALFTIYKFYSLLSFLPPILLYSII